jgi:3alpha(or 20beta)-hydroxysteroid dehydrogenase
MGRLEGKVGLITGAAGGQGECHARLFVEEGAAVVVADVREEEGRAVSESLGKRALFVPLDVGEEEHWGEAVSATVERFGKLDVLVNNAGISGGRPVPLTETSLELFHEVFRVNQLGTFLGMRACAPAMIAAGGGSIVNVASLVATGARTGFAPYVSTKWAVRGLSKTAAIELAEHGIRVNTIFPGFVDTPMVAHAAPHVREVIDTMIPLGRAAGPAEISPLVVHLASDESSYVTGAELVADGGISSNLFPGLDAFAAARTERA